MGAEHRTSQKCSSSSEVFCDGLPGTSHGFKFYFVNSPSLPVFLVCHRVSSLKDKWHHQEKWVFKIEMDFKYTTCSHTLLPWDLTPSLSSVPSSRKVYLQLSDVFKVQSWGGQTDVYPFQMFTWTHIHTPTEQLVTPRGSGRPSEFITALSTILGNGAQEEQVQKKKAEGGTIWGKWNQWEEKDINGCREFFLSWPSYIFITF